MVSDKIVRKRDRLLTRLQSEAAEQQAQRADAKKMNVLISQRRVKTAAKFKVAAVPHPFGSREEYERTLQMPLGGTDTRGLSSWHLLILLPLLFVVACLLSTSVVITYNK